MIRRLGPTSVPRRPVRAVPASLARRSRWRNEAGAATAEYVGVVLLVVVLVFALAHASLGEQLVEVLRAAICRIGGGDCAAGSTGFATPDHSAFEPEHCDTSGDSGGATAEVSVAYLQLSAGQRVARTARSNGEVVLTFEGNRGIGVTGGVGAGVDFGDEGVGAELSGNADLYGMAGESWVFDSDEDATKFLAEYARREGVKQQILAPMRPGWRLVPGVGWLAGKGAELITGDLRDADVYHAQVGVRGQMSGDLGASGGPGMSAELSGLLKSKGVLGADVDRSHKDPQKWTTAVYLEGSGGASGELSWLTGAKVGDLEGKVVIKATFDADQNLSEVSRVSTETTTVTDVEGLDESFAVGYTPEGDRRSHSLRALVSEGQRVTTETTFRLPVQDEASRKMAQEYLESGGTRNDEFEQNVRRHGHHEVRGMVGDASSTSFGLSLALGPKFGVSGTSSAETSRLVHGEFLGAPDAAGNRPMVPMSCVG